jgi:hypothetical protein
MPPIDDYSWENVYSFCSVMSFYLPCTSTRALKLVVRLISRNRIIYYHVHKILLLDPILSQFSEHRHTLHLQDLTVLAFLDLQMSLNRFQKRFLIGIVSTLFMSVCVPRVVHLPSFYIHILNQISTARKYTTLRLYHRVYWFPYLYFPFSMRCYEYMLTILLKSYIVKSLLADIYREWSALVSLIFRLHKKI